MYRIRTTLLIYYLIPIIVLLVGAGAFFYTLTKRSLDEEMGRRLVSLAATTGSFLRDYHIMALQSFDAQSRTHRAIQERLIAIQNQNDLSFIYVADFDDHSLVDTRNDVSPGTSYTHHLLHQLELSRVRQGRPSASVLFQGADQQYYKRAFAPVIQEGVTIAIVGVEANATFFNNLKTLATGLTYFVLISIVVLLTLTLILSKKIVRPIEILSEQARQIGEGHTDEPIHVALKNEIGVLGHALEDMRKSILTRDTELQTMLQGIAHEVRNPLGGIELFVGLLEEDLAESTPTQSLEKIKQEVKNLKFLVEEFLDFARGPVLVKRSIDVRDFLNETAFYFSSQLEPKGAKLNIKVTQGLQWVFDPDQLKRALFNLIQNALHALKQNGSVDLAAISQHGTLIVTVRDNGVGISPENLHRIFDPFFTTRDRGSGLGLAFVKKVVRAHGGDIAVKSELDRGTTFEIVIPSS